MSVTGKFLCFILAQLITSSALADDYSGSQSRALAGNGSSNDTSREWLADGKGYKAPDRIDGKGGEYRLAYKVDNGGGSIINPTLAAFFYHQGNTYYYLDEYPNAISNYNEAINLRPNYAEAYYFRGLAYYGNGAFKKALADFQTALSKNSFSISDSKLNPNARRMIAEVELKISETTEAQNP